MAAGFPVESSTSHKNKLKINALKMRHILKHMHASSLTTELGRGKRGREVDSPWKTLSNNCSGRSQSPESFRHTKVRALAVHRGFRNPKHKKQQKLQKGSNLHPIKSSGDLSASENVTRS